MASRLDGINFPGRDVPAIKWHLTLRFIGEVEDTTVDRITHALDEADLGGAFSIGWGGLGAFPSPSRASVLWVDVTEGRGALQDLHGRVEGALERAGIEGEDRPFNPHLTISRLRPQEDVAHLVEMFEPIGGTMRVGSIDLYESHLGRGGARYRMIDSFDLA